LILPVRLRRVASGLMIDKVRSLAMGVHTPEAATENCAGL
jgi:hypothetical protein